MTKFIQITIDSYINGDAVRIIDGSDMPLNEVHEERLEALNAVKTWLNNEIFEELKRREHHASL